jgi:hypothetical protein
MKSEEIKLFFIFYHIHHSDFINIINFIEPSPFWAKK